jgi:hypothetical protein
MPKKSNRPRIEVFLSNGTGREQSIDILVYEVCRADGIREIRLFPEEQAEKDGGAAGIEADYSENAMWFYPLGKMRGHYDENGELSFDGQRIVGLIKAWEKLGSPKVIGMAGNKSASVQ